MTAPLIPSDPESAHRWPVQMRAETAAAYCDEVSVDAFLRAVRARTYPAGAVIPGKGPRWLKEDLDAAIGRLHGRARTGRSPLRALVGG